MGKRKLPKILVTGASGTIGRNIVEDLCEYYYIYALARRTQQDAGVLAHKNIKWILAELMQSIQIETTDRILQHLVSPDHADKFKHYYELQDPNKVKWYIEVIYNLLIASVRNGDRYALVNYARSLANIRSQEGFDVAEVCRALNATGNYICSALLVRPETKGMELLIHDWIALAIQLAVDEVEDSFERIARLKKAEEEVPDVCD